MPNNSGPRKAPVKPVQEYSAIAAPRWLAGATLTSPAVSEAESAVTVTA